MAIARQCDLCGKFESLQSLPYDVDVSKEPYCSACTSKLQSMRTEIYKELDARYGAIVSKAVIVVSLLEYTREHYQEEFTIRYGSSCGNMLDEVLNAMKEQE